MARGELPLLAAGTSPSAAAAASGTQLMKDGRELPAPGSRQPSEMSTVERRVPLDDVDLVKTIGTGTFSRVYLCRHRTRHTFSALKIMTKHDMIRLKQVEHVKNEKSILQEISHPFLITLLASDQDKSFLYMHFEFVSGGELFSYLRSSGRFSHSTALFYSAEIISAIEYLHSLSVVYRDLKPENLLLDREGHLKLTDFGFAKRITDRTWTLCGTPEYLAPEIIQSKGHTISVDWWALGILIFEMLSGYPPFFDDNPFGIYEKILGGKIEWPRHIDPSAKDLIKRLLVADRIKRLGSLKNGADDVKRHRWFKAVDWDEVLRRTLSPPIKPNVSHDGDARNYDDYPDDVDWKNTPALTEREHRLFEDF